MAGIYLYPLPNPDLDANWLIVLIDQETSTDDIAVRRITMPTTSPQKSHGDIRWEEARDIRITITTCESARRPLAQINNHIC